MPHSPTSSAARLFTSSISGTKARGLAWFRWVLRRWLDLFHVHYRPELLEYLQDLDAKGVGTLTVRSVAGRYAYSGDVSGSCRSRTRAVDFGHSYGHNRGMAVTTSKVTYSLKPATVDRVQELATAVGRTEIRSYTAVLSIKWGR